MTKKLILGSMFILAIGGLAWAMVHQKRKQLEHFKYPELRKSFCQKCKWQERPLEDRIFEIPDEVLSFLTQDNLRQGWSNRPTRVTLSSENQILVKDVLRELPDLVKTKAGPLLAGLFFVKDLGGTAYSDYLVDDAGNPFAGFIVFDELIFKMKANEWATWKEKSPFKLDERIWDLRMTIEKKEDDNIKSAFQFIAPHEFGHIVSINSGMHPPWGYPMSSDKHPSKYEFSKLSWTLDDDTPISLFDDVFPLRNQIHFYKGDFTTNIEEVYRELERTHFPTLYSATNMADDFADSFASLVHVVLFKRPYKIVLLKNGNPTNTLRSCWGQSRCLEKVNLLRNFLNVE